MTISEDVSLVTVLVSCCKWSCKWLIVTVSQ